MSTTRQSWGKKLKFHYLIVYDYYLTGQWSDNYNCNQIKWHSNGLLSTRIKLVFSLNITTSFHRPQPGGNNHDKEKPLLMIGPSEIDLNNQIESNH